MNKLLLLALINIGAFEYYPYRTLYLQYEERKIAKLPYPQWYIRAVLAGKLVRVKLKAS